MDRFRFLGFVTVAVALLGVTLLLGEPAAADPKDCVGDQGLTTANLGI